MENKPKIKIRNFWIWFKDQVKRRRVFINFFVTRNAWGAFSINSHINQHNGKEKVMYADTVFFGFKRISLQKICSVNGFLMNVALKVKRLKNLPKNMSSRNVIR